jgi:hypothetical protein
MLMGLQEALTEVMVGGLGGGVLPPPPPQPAAYRPQKKNRTRAVLGLVLGLMHIPFTNQDAKGEQLEGYRSPGLFIQTL